jgi:hypothetical protein
MVLGPPALAEGGVAKSGCDVKILPYHEFGFQSPMKPDVAMRVLQARIEPPSWFRLRWPSSTNDSRFEGDIAGDRFSVMRIIGYQNSFLPRVLGTVKPRGGGSHIHIRMRLHIQMLIILAGLPVLLFFLGAPILTDVPNTLMATLAIYALVMGAFWFEANKQERVLRELFRAERELVI